MTVFLKVEHKNNKADINFETSFFKHTLTYIHILLETSVTLASDELDLYR